VKYNRKDEGITVDKLINKKKEKKQK